MSERRPGRPRTEAPAGYVTVSEAAALLGVSDAAIRRRMDRGTLPFETEPQETASGKQEVRIYIPREAIEKAMSEKMLPATKEDTSEVRVQMSEATELVLRRFAEHIGELRQGQLEVLTELKKQGEDRRRQFEYIIELLKRGQEDAVHERDERRAATELEKKYQEEMLDRVGKFLELQERHVKRWSSDERPLWKRILGI